MTKNEKKFQKMVDKLREWINENGDTPEITIAALGSVISGLIWQYTVNGEAANAEAADIATRIKMHVETLNKTYEGEQGEWVQ